MSEVPEFMREGRNEDQLHPQAMPYHNAVMHGPPGTDIGDLSSWVGEDESGWVVNYSSWGFDAETRDKVAAGAHIRLGVWQHPIPPLAVAVEGPWCDVHQTEHEWDGASYFCAQCRNSDVPEDLRRDFRPDDTE